MPILGKVFPEASLMYLSLYRCSSKGSEGLIKTASPMGLLFESIGRSRIKAFEAILFPNTFSISKYNSRFQVLKNHFYLLGNPID